MLNAGKIACGVRLVGLSAVVACTALTQTVGTWTLLAPSNPPPPSVGSLVYDQGRGRAVLFGGSALWEFDGTNWAGPIVDPSGDMHQQWWDPQRGTIVQIFVTYSGVYPIAASLRTWNGSAWTTLFPVGTPNQRMDDGAFVFDHLRNVAVRHLGDNNRSDTWEMGTTWGAPWARRSAGGPLPRTGEAMVYDPVHQEVVLVGGRGTTSVLGDTWTWDGIGWTEHYGVPSPAVRDAAIAFDPHRGRVVHFGGMTNVATSNSLAEWNGSAWSAIQTQTSPPALSRTSLAYDTQRNRMILFGGLNSQGNATNQTWVLEAASGQPANFTTFGTGCAGPSGVPTVGRVGNELPTIGTTCNVTISNLPSSPFNVALGVAGFDNQTWNGQQLPVSLTPLGITGCTAWVRPEIGVYLSNVNGVATWSIAVPFVPSLIGTSIYVQGGVSVPGWNPAGFIASNAAHLVIGS